MPHFILTAKDKPGALDLRVATRPAHLEWINANRAMIRLAGPLLDEAGDMAGSLFVLEAESLDAAKAACAQDPFNLAGVFESVEVKPWRCTIGEVP